MSVVHCFSEYSSSVRTTELKRVESSARVPRVCGFGFPVGTVGSHYKTIAQFFGIPQNILCRILFVP